MANVDRPIADDSSSVVPVASEPAADAEQVARFIREVGTIGRDPRGGWSRLAFSPEERHAHEVFAGWAKELGLVVSRDVIGNTFGDLVGTSTQQALVVGSHLDTVPRGGSFDGVAGIAAALEAARVLAAGRGLLHTLRLAVFAGEEGARFGAPCIGSRVATGALTSDMLKTLVDDSGRSVAQCAIDVGLRPGAVNEAVWPRASVAAYIELHIEQGGVLEKRARQIGIVDAIAEARAFSSRLRAAPIIPEQRRWKFVRTLVCSGAEFILHAERQASVHPTTVATVGKIKIEPDSVTTVPGEARVWLDVRDIDSDAQRELAEQLIDHAVRVVGRRKLQVAVELLSDQSPVLLHKPIRERLGRASSELGISFCVLPSGAGHDAAHIASIAPTGMIFVPSRGGVSHAPEEWSEAEDIARGVDVLVGALKSLDSEGPSKTSQMPASTQ